MSSPAPDLRRLDGWHFVSTMCCGKARMAAVGLPGAAVLVCCPDHAPQAVGDDGKLRTIDWTQPPTT